MEISPAMSLLCVIVQRTGVILLIRNEFISKILGLHLVFDLTSTPDKGLALYIASQSQLLTAQKQA